MARRGRLGMRAEGRPPPKWTGGDPVPSNLGELGSRIAGCKGHCRLVQSLKQLVDLMQRHGANRIFAKKLAPNDNSKNQVYLGGDFSALNIIPHGDIYVDDQVRAGSKRARPKAPVRFAWIDAQGKHPAPGANLILYPDYPEVRLSGFLQGCRRPPSEFMNKRLDGRVMFFGVTRDGEVLGYVVADGDPVGNEIKAGQFDELGVFLELPRSEGKSPGRSYSVNSGASSKRAGLRRRSWTGMERRGPTAPGTAAATRSRPSSASRRMVIPSLISWAGR